YQIYFLYIFFSLTHSCFFTFHIFSLFSFFFTVFTHIFLIFTHFFQNIKLTIIPTHVECVLAIGHAMWRFFWLGWGSSPQLRNRQPFGVPCSSMPAKHSVPADLLLLYPTLDEWHVAMKRIEFPWGA
ncbi:hypothetical protein AB205_0031310, partial [Aquarana catesbeiana]